MISTLRHVLAPRVPDGTGRLLSVLLALVIGASALPLAAAAQDPLASVPPSVAGPALAPSASVAPTASAPAVAPCDSGSAALDTSFARSILTSVVTDGAGAWAVGMTTLTEDPRYALAIAWDGTGWPEMPMRRPKSEQALFAIDRGPGGSLWAAGYRNTGGGYRPMLMRWTAGRWIPVQLGAFGRRTGVLTGIDALTDRFVWAVGYRSVRGGQRPFALRHDASGWSEADPPLAGGTDGALMDVESSPNGRATWAVGWVSVQGSPHPYAVQRVRGRWRVSRPDLRRGSEGVLTAVTVEPSGHAWAVGYRLTRGRYLPLVQRWDGRRWRDMPFPVDGSDITLMRGVQLDSHGQPVLAGTRWDAELGEWRGIVAQRVSGHWRTTDMPVLDGGSELRDVAGGPDGDALAVGASGGRSLALGVCPTDTATAPSPTPGPGTTAPPPPVGSHAPSLPSASPPPPSSQPSAVPRVPAPSAVPGGVPAAAEPSSAPGEASPTAAPSERPRPSPRAGRPPKASPLARRRGGYHVVARDVAAQAGLDLDTSTYGAVRADFDRDGWPDLFIGRHSNPGLLVLNTGGRYERAPGVEIRRQDRHGCTAGDANGDGRPDLFCALGSLHGAGMKTDELWIQQADGTFEDRAVEMRAADPVGRGRLALFFDLDHDRHADLFIADRPDRTDGLPSRHRVLANPSGSHYEPRSVIGFDAASGADCLRSADLDRDGWQDIILCQRAISRPDGVGIRVLRNVKGRLIDVTARVGIPVANVVDAVVADMDGDHRPDIVQVTPWELRVWIRRGSRYVPGYHRTLTSAVAVAAGDVNGDGAPDLYVAQGTGDKQVPDLMLVNGGGGWRYRSMSIPQARTGSAESVIATDHDRNGLTDFLVLNGRGSLRAGPVQLIAFYPARAARSSRSAQRR